MKKIFLIIALLIGILSGVYAQPAVGQFRDHLACHRFYDVAVTPTCVYAATENHLMIVDKENNFAVSSWSKVEGLSEVGISEILYDSVSQFLIVAYKNSNIDFIAPDGSLYNVNDIKNKSFSSSKRINNIFVDNGIAYFLCDFGVVLINIETFLIQDTWFTTLNGYSHKVQDLTLHGDEFYLATEDGVWHTGKDNLQISDFSTWIYEEELSDININQIVSFGNYLIANKYNSLETKDSLYIKENGTWRYAPELFAYYVNSMVVRGDEFMTCDWEWVHIYDAQLQLKQSLQWQSGLVLQGKCAQFDAAKWVWVADSDWGLYQVNRENKEFTGFVKPGPRTDKVGAIACFEEKTAVISNSQERYNYSYTPGSLNIFANEEWSYNYNAFTDFQYPWDFRNVIFNPQNSAEIFITSWMGGVFRVENNVVVEQFMSENSPLEEYYPHNNYVSTSGMAFDKANNLWITNSKCGNLLKVRKASGDWLSIQLPYVSSEEGVVAEWILVDRYNKKWITIPRSNKLVVYDDNNTLDNLTDDIVRLVDLNSAANVSTQQINCIVEDKNGNIWIGTDLGIKIVYNSSNLMKNPIYAKNIFITQDGYTQNLLEHESITCIVVDGANRKWVGTARAGLFLISESGTEEIAKFNESNSLLFSNQINAMNINPVTGELFIATASGLMGYRTDASEGREDYSELKVFPNPVRESYTGTITVSGMMENALCKITDANGLLIWQDYANGGTFSWDGKDFYGNRPATGVYFVMASDKTGKKRATAKILIIN